MQPFQAKQKPKPITRRQAALNVDLMRAHGNAPFDTPLPSADMLALHKLGYLRHAGESKAKHTGKLCFAFNGQYTA